MYKIKQCFNCDSPFLIRGDSVTCKNCQHQMDEKAINKVIEKYGCGSIVSAKKNKKARRELAELGVK